MSSWYWVYEQASVLCNIELSDLLWVVLYTTFNNFQEQLEFINMFFINFAQNLYLLILYVLFILLK